MLDNSLDAWPLLSVQLARGDSQFLWLFEREERLAKGTKFERILVGEIHSSKQTRGLVYSSDFLW